jgi:hypothetical protein
MPVDPIVIESDGTRPVVVVRTDVKDANSALAKRIILSANRVQEVDFQPDEALLASLLTELQNEEGVTGSGYSDADLDRLVEKLKDVDLEAAFAGVSGESEKGFRQMTFVLHVSQADVVEEAVRRAIATKKVKSKNNDNINGNALFFIAKEFNKTCPE